MGFFSFLEPQQDQPKKATGYVPEGWKVRKPGEDFWRIDEKETSEGDELQGPDNIPKATEEEMKPYSQRRGESSSKVFQTADLIIDNLTKDLPYLKRDAEQAKRVIRANPEDAAKAVEKLYETAKKSNPGTSYSGGQLLPNLYDQNFSALENHVRGLRTMKRGSEEKVLTGRLEQTDLNKNLRELEGLRGQLDSLTKDIANQNLPEAVSKRGELENKSLLAGKQQQAAALAEHIKQLESVTGATKVQPDTTAPASNPSLPAPATPYPVMHFMDGLGLNKEFMTSRVHAALDNIGIPREQWEDSNVDPAAGLLRVMSSLDKDGNFARAIVQQMSLARQQDAAEKQSKGGGKETSTDPRMAQTEAQIQSKEQEMRALYATLRETPFMRTWPGIILYVLVGMLTQNPAFAARLIGGVGNREAVGNEIKGIQFEIRRLDQQLQRQEREDAYTKREAARRLQRKEDVEDQRKHEYAKMIYQHNLIIKRNAARGNPETFLIKKLASDFQRNLGMASKFSGEMQNEFADPKVRQTARENFNLYMRRAAEVDADIRKLGGGVTDQESEDAEE